MKNFKFVLLLLVLTSLNVSAQEEETKPIKKGWSFGVLPTITYNSDLGLQYGGLIDLYNYGEGEIYPKYYERYYLEISRFTKGSGINNFSFESNRLLKGRTIFIDIDYRPDSQYDFFGGNGYESVYNSAWESIPEDINKEIVHRSIQEYVIRVLEVEKQIIDNEDIECKE